LSQHSDQVREEILKEIKELLSEGGPVSLIPKQRTPNQTFADRMAEKLTNFVGSWTFALSMAAIVLAWFLGNIGLFIFVPSFDPYPFNFLNLILAAVAAFQAPVILMAQNAQYRRDLQREIHQYEVILAVEGELRALYNKLSHMGTDVAVAIEELEFSQDQSMKGLSEISGTISKNLSSAYGCHLKMEKLQDTAEEITVRTSVLLKLVKKLKETSDSLFMGKNKDNKIFSDETGQ